MTEEMEFFLYLLEHYAEYKDKRTKDVLKEWEDTGIIDKIYDNYWTYHSERIENAYMDIDSLVQTGHSAW